MLKVPDSILVNKVQECAHENSLYIFKDAKIFHHADILDIPLLVVDPKRGIYIFEYKTWCYNEIKSLKAAKSSQQDSSKNSLAFESKQKYIKRRFNEILNNDGADIFNFVLMENLTKEEFERLDSSFHELIPQSRTLFSSDSVNEIKEKLFGVSDKKHDILDINSIISTLFVQNTIICEDHSIQITSDDQNAIIRHDFRGINFISAKDCSGKTSTILLKAVYEHLLNKEKNICIIEPTNIACELFKQKLLYLVEHSIVEVDFSKISVITTHDFKNKKTDYILVDNASMLNKSFLDYLTSLKKDTVIFENHDELKTYRFSLNNNYRAQSTIELLNGNPYALTFVNIRRLLEKGVLPKDILIITTEDDDRYKILEDLHSFVEDVPVILDPFETINNQELGHILIANYDEIFGFSRDYVFIFDPKDIETNIINFIFSRAGKKTFVIYDQDNKLIGKMDAKDI
ncbi:hypothetical protein [Sulfurimonas sp. HSL-1716]|uniref:hypothetical protein n=1 Tax=Hydrocurvibacter sulfurireducens TaxID=3131937 RepID=UPI0031F73C8E